MGDVTAAQFNQIRAGASAIRETVLVTGGAGFIGTALCTELLRRGAHVKVLDALIEQVHGPDPSPRLPAEIEFVHGDVRDSDTVSRALEGVDSVIHLAAEVGVGQSMYAIERYTSTNELGTAVLLEQMVTRPIRRMLTASSMSIYGEGLYRAENGTLVEDARRNPDRLRARRWDPIDANLQPLRAMPTPEWKRPELASIYAIGKYVQERAPLAVAGAYDFEAAALRLWNVYGPGQALSNPYTGVLAIFAARIANARPPMVFEDGMQLRDFVHVDDVARAFAAALTAPKISGEVINIASGEARTVLDVAQRLAHAMGSDIGAEITQSGRSGDIRHCIADIEKARRVLGFEPQERFDERLIDLAGWVTGQSPEDRVAIATSELRERGLVH